MNQKERQHLELVDYKIDEIKQDINELKQAMDKAHEQTDESLRFIKENLFNPSEGLWAETKLNTQFREDTKKWRTDNETKERRQTDDKRYHDCKKNR